MAHYPDFAAFCELAKTADYVPVYRRVLSDVLTPVSAFHKIDDGGNACLFESVIGGEKVGRYSFLAAEPYLLLEAHGNESTVTAVRDGAFSTSTVKNPIDVLREHVQAVRVAKLPGLPPFVGGAVGYAGYDTVRYVEHLPNAPEDDRHLPDLSFAFYDHMIVFDNVQKTAIVVVLAKVAEERGARSEERDSKHSLLAPRSSLLAAYDDACWRVDRFIDKLSTPTDSLTPTDIASAGESQLRYQSNFTQSQFEDAVRKSAEYIRAGDIFQVVLSQRLTVPLAVDPFEVYRTLRVVNPSPFMFFLRTRKCTLVGSSPEIMVRVVDGKVTVRPLAGTRRRGRTDEEDAELATELLADPKERAEHVMLVDLGRNDVGRVAQFGSVEISDVMVIERYSHVMHITSNVTGQLTEDRDAFDALAACLPAGTVSGAPKVRAMEIIDELEPHRRGPYGGAVGYIDFAGNMDTCIALRTMVIQDGTAYIQAGAGIVADSVPEREYEETLNKARGLLKAIEITQNAQATIEGRVVETDANSRYNVNMATISLPVTDLSDIAPLHQFSSADYLEMIDKGVLGPKDRVELVGGFIVNMSPQGSRHNSFLMQLNRLFAPLHDRFIIAIQGTLTVTEGQIFDPDFLLLRQKPEGYKNKLPDASDVQLVIEGAESSLRFDQRIKLPVYATAEISEYWIADLEREVMIVHREPKAGRYTSIEERQGDEAVSPLVAPELSFAVRRAFD